MSSKTAKNTAGDRTTLTSRWSWSITGRLTLLHTLSAFGMLVLSTAFLYWVLANNLERKDNQFLADEIHVLRVILQEHPNDLRALEEEVKWEGAALQFTTYYARILDEERHTLIETPGMGIIPASLFPAPTGVTEASVKQVKWRFRDSRSYLLMSAWAAVGHSGGKQRLIQVALDMSYEDALLADYRLKLAMVLFLGISFAAGTGIVVARKGMHPLGEIAKAAQQITVTQFHKRLEPTRWPKELVALATAFDEMLNRLEDSFTRLSQFSADLAHELRTPINNLMGEAEVALSRPRTPEEYRQILESNLEEYAKLSRMIDSLLFLARAESTENSIKKLRFSALQEIEAVCEFHDAVAEERGVVVTCQGEAFVHADATLFRRAISNLLSNALQYTPRGGKIAISVKQSAEEWVEVSVSDTGPGIEPEHLPKIFDRFYRADRSRAQHPEGTGLGLAIVKSIMELHGGTVTIQSEPTQGTTVTLKFPPPV